MPQTPMTLPNLPDAEALKTARPASSAAALPLVQAPGYTLGLRALRTHTQHFTLEEWQDDVVANPAETRRVLYRPSPLARRLWVCAWVGTDWRGLTSPPSKVEVAVSVIDDATLSPVVLAGTLTLTRPQRPGYAGDWLPALPFNPGNSDLNRGTEQIASIPWDGIDVSGLNGLDGWVQVRAEGASILSVTWVELVEQEHP